MKRYLQYLGPVLVLAVFVAVLWMLHEQLRHYRLQDFRASLAMIPWTRVFLAVLLTVLNYLVLVGYDYLAVRYVGHRLSLAKIALGSFIGYVSSFNFGALLGGTSVRYRLYSAWGFSTAEILELVAFLGLTFWTGVIALAGTVLVLTPLPPGARWLRLIGLGAVLLAAGYFTIVAVRRKPIRLFGWRLMLPTLPVALMQTAIAAGDLVLAASVLYILLPASAGVSFLGFLWIYLVAAVAAVFAHVPGGLGVIELTVLALLSPPDPSAVMASLLVFRAIYYMLPLGLAAVLLAIHEVLLRKEWAGRVVRAMGQLLPAAVPELLGLLVFIAGATLLLSGAIPSADGQLPWIANRLPLAVIEVSHFLSSVCGAVLLILAHGLERRIAAAWRWACGMLTAGALISAVWAISGLQCAALLVLLVLLGLSRQEFYRRGALFRERLTPTWWSAVVVVLAASVGLALFIHKPVDYSSALWWRFDLHADAPRVFRALVGAASVLLMVLLAEVLRPAHPRFVRRSPPPPTVVRAIVAASPHTYAYQALTGDVKFLVNEQQTGLAMYVDHERSRIVLGDPVGPPDAKPELAWQFVELCEESQRWPVFYEASDRFIPLYVDLGLSLLEIEEEARVPLAGFTRGGSAGSEIRRSDDHLRCLGCSFRVVAPEELPDLAGELSQIDDAWRATKGCGSGECPTGGWPAPALRDCPVVLIDQGPQVQAFGHILCGADREELSLEAVRCRPGAAPGMIDDLVVETMAWGRRQGYRWINLGAAPLTRAEDDPLQAFWAALGLRAFAFGEHFHSFAELRQFKEQFHPIWRAQYLASPGGLQLRHVLDDVAAAIAERSSRPR